MDKEIGKGLEARLVALDLFGQIYRKSNPMDQVLQRSKELNELEARDRAFVRLLLTTLLRKLGQIDFVIEQFLENASGLKSPVVLDILRFGAVQLLYLKTPPHAAVSASVELAENYRGLSRYKGVINAILRKVSDQGLALLSKTALEMNTPQWLREMWVRDYGTETAMHILKANGVEPPLDITVKRDANGWAEKLSADILPTESLRLTQAGQVHLLDGFEEGAWWVQDLSSSLPVKVMGDIAGKKVLDLCAAPGGKTAQLLAHGAHVTALDRSPQRMKRFEENMDRLGFTDVKTEVADAALWESSEQFDIVMVDAPCSATGTIRRHPDMPYQKKPEDIEKLSVTQRRILSNAASLVTDGGDLIYCTCSLQKCEGEEQVAWFLGEHPEFEIVPISVEGLEQTQTTQGFVRVLPFHLSEKGGMDGFFVAKLRKNA